MGVTDLNLADLNLATELRRLADLGERLLARQERKERDERDEELKREWGPAVAPVDIWLFVRSIPGLAALFDHRVPDEYVAQTDDRVLTVACPCGQDTVVKHRRMAECRCGRYFLHDGTHIHVALSPKPTSA